MRNYIFRILAFFGGIFFAFFSFIAYQHISPGYLSDITFSDGQRNVVFLEMSHIATAEFYADKREKLIQLSASGYNILMEWVQSGSTQSEAKVAQALGFELTPTLYSTISDLVGLQAQDNDFLYEWLPSSRLKSVDISIDTLAGYLSGASLSSSGSIPLDIENSIIMTDINDREKALVSYVYRGILNFFIKNTDTMSDNLNIAMSPDLSRAILDERNQRVIEYIQAHPRQDIVVVYGALHTSGVTYSLQKSDPSWKIFEYSLHTPYQESR
jgi:hypothetical protein